jgi:DNA-binding beta-propeller fold protein YncE
MKHAIIAAVTGLLVLMTAGCYKQAEETEEECPPVAGLNYLCGPDNAEDLVRIPGTQFIVGSGMSGNDNPGKLQLIDTESKSFETLYPGSNAQNELDAEAYVSCPGSPDPKTFGPHGIAIRDDGNRTSTLLAVNHGREAIEVFKIDAAGMKPSIRWIGCVPVDKTISVNSVAFLPGDGFVLTKFYDPTSPEGFGAILQRKSTGRILEWHPDSGMKPLAGTELAGANGIEVSKDGKSIYVAAWGTQEVVRFTRRNGDFEKEAVKVDFWPDNLRWAPDGTILVAGQTRDPNTAGGNLAFKGWAIMKLDPETMEVSEVLRDRGESPLQNASVAIEVDGTLWIGSFSADRIAYKLEE